MKTNELLQKLTGIGEKNKNKYTVEEGEIVQPLSVAQTLNFFRN